MVTVSKGIKPDVLPAYMTCPLSLKVLDAVHDSFAIGAFARFGNPSVELFIHDRPDFHHKPHHEVRDVLDAEGETGPFLLLEERTEEQDAVWYIASTETAEAEGEDDEDFIRYEGETLVLRIWIKVLDVPLQHINLDIGNTSIVETLDMYPYDPHADQDEPYTLGEDMENNRSYFPPVFITAGDDEVEVSEDLENRKKFLIGRGPPDMVVRLREEVAAREGLLPKWSPGNKDGDGRWRIQTEYDPESERWGGYVPLQR